MIANDLTTHHLIDGNEIATVSWSGPEVTVKFADGRLKPRTYDRWEQVPDDVTHEDDEPEPEPEPEGEPEPEPEDEDPLDDL